MKSNAPKILALLLLVIFSATIVGVARGGRHRRHQDRPLRREIRAYFQANIRPMLQQQRQKLEPQLSAADRTQLATYRTQLQALKEQGITLRRSVMPEGPAAVRTEARQQQAHDLRFQTRGIMLSVAQMARKYDAPITRLTQEVAPQQEQWAAAIKAIGAKNAPSGQAQLPAAGPGRQHEPGGLRRFFRPVMFLLLDPNAPAANQAEPGVSNPSFYPNPAAAFSQLDYEVRKTGPVTIDLLDKDGRKLRTLVSEASQEKGPQTRQLDLHEVPAGTYFYKITTTGGSQTKRFVKE